MQQYFKKKEQKSLLPPCAPQKKIINSSIDQSTEQSRQRSESNDQFRNSQISCLWRRPAPVVSGSKKIPDVFSMKAQGQGLIRTKTTTEIIPPAHFYENTNGSSDKASEEEAGSG